LVPLLWIARTQRADGAEYAAIEHAARVLLDDHLAADDRAFIEYTDRPQVLAYAADGRTILHVLPTYTSGDYARLRAAFPASWLLAPVDSAAVAGLGAEPGDAVGTIDVAGATWGLFALPD
jgi:hypothetical protein